MTYGLVLGMNVTMMVGVVLTAVLMLAHVEWARIVGLSAWVLWMIVVAVPYLLDEYATLVRLTKGR